MEGKKKLGLPSVVATGVGVIAIVQLVPDTINFVSFRRRRRKRSKPIRQSVDW